MVYIKQPNHFGTPSTHHAPYTPKKAEFGRTKSRVGVKLEKKNRKVLRIAQFGEKINQKSFWKFWPPRPHLAQKPSFGENLQRLVIGVWNVRYD